MLGLSLQGRPLKGLSLNGSSLSPAGATPNEERERRLQGAPGLQRAPERRLQAHRAVAVAGPVYP